MKEPALLSIYITAELWLLMCHSACFVSMSPIYIGLGVYLGVHLNIYLRVQGIQIKRAQRLVTDFRHLFSRPTGIFITLFWTRYHLCFVKETFPKQSVVRSCAQLFTDGRWLLGSHECETSRIFISLNADVSKLLSVIYQYALDKYLIGSYSTRGVNRPF